MKKSVIMTVLSLGLLAAPFAVSAKSFEEAYVESYEGRSDIPVPTSVVSPEVDRKDIGTSVELVFVVDELGQPTEISARTRVAKDLADELIDAVSKWRFAPQLAANGNPVARKVMLPVHVVSGTSTKLLVAAN